jgi:hypothetical protein
MRFMLLLKGDPPTDRRPDPSFLEAMRAYDADLRKAGVVLASEGLRPSATGTRLRFDGSGSPTIVDGPVSASREVVGGFYILQVRSRDEAIEWARRCPVDLALRAGEEVEVEVREVDEGQPG